MFFQEILSGKSHVRLELLYSQKGSRTDANNNNRLLINYNYIDMPMLVKYTFFDRLSPYLGVQPGFLIKRSVHLKGHSSDYSSDSGESKGKLAAIAGTEYALSKKFAIDIRYDRGLLGKGYKSHVLQLGISMRLNK